MKPPSKTTVVEIADGAIGLRGELSYRISNEHYIHHASQLYIVIASIVCHALLQAAPRRPSGAASAVRGTCR
jgi:hypothetical protein